MTLVDGWLSDFLKQCQLRALWRLHSTRDLLLCFGAQAGRGWGGREEGGSAVRGLAQSFLKSILALQALDNLENIIQNSPFQHVSSIKGVFSSRVSTMLVWPRNAQIRLKRKKEKVHLFSISFSKHLLDPGYVCLCGTLWISLLRTEHLNYDGTWYYFIFKAFWGCFPL